MSGEWSGGEDRICCYLVRLLPPADCRFSSARHGGGHHPVGLLSCELLKLKPTVDWLAGRIQPQESGRKSRRIHRFRRKCV